MRTAPVLLLLAATLTACTPRGGVAPSPALPSLTPDAAEERGCRPAPPAAGTARARHVTCADDLDGGPLGMGRVGDVLLENARLRVVLRAGGESATTIGAPAGGILDATPASSAPAARVDGIKEVLPTLDLHALVPGELTVVRATGEEAVVRASFVTRAIGLIASVLPVGGGRPPVTGVLEYALRADEPFVRIRICGVPEEGDAVEANPGLAALLGGAMEVLAPGTGVLAGDVASASAPALFAESPALAYAAAVDGSGLSILHAQTVTLASARVRSRFARAEAGCAAMRFAVAATEAEVATALLGAAGGTAIDLAVPAGGRAEVRDDGGRVILRSRELGGRVRATLPAGTYRLAVARPGGAFGDPEAPPPTGTLVVRAAVRGEAGAPVRITVAGLDGLAVDQRFVVLGGERRFAAPAGRYRVSASRGGEYTVDTATVELAAGGETPVALGLERVVDTVGYVATDFHLHTELSTDSVHPLGDAVRQMAAEGLEVVASTDHDFISDLAPLVAAGDVGDWLVAVPGEEVSTVELGHVGGYPLGRDPARAGAGAVPWFGLSPGQIFRALRDRGDDVVVQANHPRLRGSGLFDQIGLDVATGTVRGDPTRVGLPAGTDLSDLSFEVVEVWNGYTRGDNERAFTDVLALRLAGRRFVLVGNSDSHRPDLPPGAPRSYVRVPDDRRGRFAWPDVRRGLRDGDVSVAAGIFVDVAAPDGTRPGGVVRAASGRTTLHVRVQAPPWVDCSRLRVYRGLEVVIDRPIATPRTDVIRFDADLTVDTPRDTFLVVRADGTTAAEPVFPWNPVGFSNPLTVDADGDGR